MTNKQFAEILKHLRFDFNQTCWGYFQITGSSATLGAFDRDNNIDARLELEAVCHTLKIPVVARTIALPQTYSDQAIDADYDYIIALWVDLEDN